MKMGCCSSIPIAAGCFDLVSNEVHSLVQHENIALIHVQQSDDPEYSMLLLSVGAILEGPHLFYAYIDGDEHRFFRECFKSQRI
jgi:hypothetical protein